MWKTIALILIGLVVGFAGGNAFYSAVLDKPEVVYETNNETSIKKNKTKGNNNKSDVQLKTDSDVNTR